MTISHLFHRYTQGTCTYLIGKGLKRILIDTGEGNSPSYIKNMKRALLNSAATSIEAILITHNHHDHTGGIQDLRNTYGHKVPVYMMRTPGKELPKGVKEMKDGQIFETIGTIIYGYHFVPQGSPSSRPLPSELEIIIRSFNFHKL